MSPLASRRLPARALASVLAALLVLGGAALPAAADESPEPVVVTTDVPEEGVPDEGVPDEGAPEEDAPDEDAPAEGAADAEPRFAPLGLPTAPTLVVSKTTGLDASGETVTVSGSGYNPAQAFYLLICRDIPLDDVDFAFAAGCTAGSKQVTPTPTTPTMVQLEADGTFETTFTVSRNPAFTSGSAIYTVANHTAMNDRTQDAKQPIAFSPLLTVSKAVGLDASGETITVTGSGYNPAQPFYLFLCNDVPLTSVSFSFAAGCTAGSKQVTPNPTTATMVQLESDGTFTTTFTVSRKASWNGVALYTAANHTAMNDRTQDARRPLAFTPLLTVTPATELDPSGQTVTVTGSGYNPAQPFYLFICRDVPVSEVTFTFAAGCTAGSKQVTPTPTTATMVKLESDGTFTTTLDVAANAAFTSGTAIYTAANHTAMNDRTQDARRPIAFTGAAPTQTTVSAPTTAQRGTDVEVTVAVTPASAGTVELTGAGSPRSATLDAEGRATFSLSGLAVGSYSLTAAFTPSNPLLREASSGSAALEVVTTQVGSLTWGIKAGFRDYVTGTIARGSITTSGATSSGGAFGFTQVSGALDGSGLGSIGYGGTVRFTGHDGALDLRFADPLVRIESASSGTLLVRVNGATVALAELRLSAGTRSSVDGVVSYRGVPAVLTAAGAAAFDGFYGAGEALDPVSFTVGAAGTAAGGTRTIAAFAPAGNTPAATPPATEGVESEATAFREGGTYTFTAGGFQPGETGILAVVYSAPVVLADDLTADADGVVRWTGALPAGLSGRHTFTFQGSVDRGLVIEIAEAEVLGCAVDAAELDWGFKESFRAYLDGSIANGGWETADGATYATPLFSFTGAGSYDAETGDTELDFAGSIRFTGHGGVLDMTVANPRVVVNGDRAVLLLDITGETQDGRTVSAPGVEFVELDLEAAERTEDGDAIAWTGVPATLAAAGATAFGTYDTGTEFDPIDLRVALDADCVEPVAEPEAATTSVETEPSSDSSSIVGIVLAVLAALAIAVAIVLLVRRARRA
mgnify:CR=1 FL=1|jgi:Htaa.